MFDRPALPDLIEVRRQYRLPHEALVETDWLVVRALAAVAAADKGPFQLVFQGGTALSRAHRVVERMSEDIDIKIVSKGAPARTALRRLRESITGELLKAGFKFDPKNPEHLESNYESRYTLYRLPYEPIAAGQGALRPEIQIETSVWAVRRLPIELPVISFVAEAFKRPAEVPAIACATIAETAAEKFVALTRRAGAVLAGVQRERDPTLVLHIYDLHAIREHYDAADVAAWRARSCSPTPRRMATNSRPIAPIPSRRHCGPSRASAPTRPLPATTQVFGATWCTARQPIFETAIATLKTLADTLQSAQDNQQS